MYETLALKPMPLPEQRTKSVSLGAMFKAALESLVKAQSHRFENVDPLMFRYPPF